MVNNDELESLKKKVLQTDFSLNNPKMRDLIIMNISRWVGYYETTKTYPPDKDSQGNPTTIPDEIEIEGRKYSPQDILRLSKNDDLIGKKVLRLVYDAWLKEELCMAKPDVLSGVINEMPSNLDAVCLKCPCGQHYETTRRVLESIINCNSHFFFNPMAKAVIAIYQKLK